MQEGPSGPSGFLFKNVFENLMVDKSIFPNGKSLLESFAQGYYPLYRDKVAEKWSELVTKFPDSHYLERKVRCIIYTTAGFLVDHSFLATNTGYLGTALTAIKAVQKGDLLVIIHGCYFPAVLRPKGAAYEIVTFAHVSDVMKGEFVEDIDNAMRNSQRFRLC